MKFLVDANLPPDLCVWLRVRGQEAEHLADLNLLSATDTQLWDRGKVQRLIVITKDVDFYDRALVLGAPPQVLHVDVGNCSNTQLFEILSSGWTNIEAALFAGSRLISINREKIGVFA